MQEFQKGARFGEWTVTETVRVRSAERVPVQCSCGAQGSVIANSLGRGKSLRCASCAASRAAAKKQATRQAALEYELLLPSRFPAEYRVWSGMISRCHGRKPHKDYGERGVTVCGAWRSAFFRFLQDMGVRPGLEYSIDRIEVDGNYEPGNCRWATKTEQARNRRDNSGEGANQYRAIRYQRKYLAMLESSGFYSPAELERRRTLVGEMLCAHLDLPLRSTQDVLEKF